MWGLDGEEMWHADFREWKGVSTLPGFGDHFGFGAGAYDGAVQEMEICKQNLDLLGPSFNYPMEFMNRPKALIYSEDHMELGSENTLVCYVTGFYPPEVTVSWTRNDVKVTCEATVSRYYPTGNGTFKLISHLSFTPEEGDIYTCTVEHPALYRPLTKTWDGYCHFTTDECVTSTSDLSDAEYIETLYFNRDPFMQFNSTVGLYVGFNSFGVHNAEIWNNGTTVLFARAQLERICKPNLQLFYSSILDKSVKPKVNIVLEKPSKDGQPATLTCSSYKFYPPAIEVYWLKDGIRVTSDVVSTEVMANGNWHYQVHSQWEHTPKSGENISCVVEHVSSDKPIIQHWEGSLPKSDMPDAIKIAVGASGLALGIILSAVGLAYYCKKKSSGVGGEAEKSISAPTSQDVFITAVYI
ncbi:hypothetical protein NFI96_029394 [Prochilodus magdalenae]|nr:hypothetical protein NFI96_029394 [Prochilodus magdalenae]